MHRILQPHRPPATYPRRCEESAKHHDGGSLWKPRNCRPLFSQIAVSSNTPELIIKNANVGVSFTSMKKVCESIKSQIFRPNTAGATPRRYTAFAGIVKPRYDQYPQNAIGCLRITDPYCNPPAGQVRRWAGIYEPATWEHSGASRVICLNPQDLDKEGLPIGLLE